ncbi:hypothetical protein ACT8ZV_02900 [Nocardioides sp. MAHUQ-72]|uniref:hypothetical protein n=1 Tax=unclassified Nocardioides TaxID=2615069 RepID=UPI00360673C0
MTWVTTSDAARFLAGAGPFLVSDPVANNALLTEASFWAQLPDPAPGARFGWWAEGGETGGAFVDIPDHPVLCSPLGAAAVADLAHELAGATSVAVQASDVDALDEAWRARGGAVRTVATRTLLRLVALREPAQPAGAPRVADAGDLPLLRSWFDLFAQRHPDDSSHVEFVVDHPLRDGAVVIWEVGDEPVAMCSRTPRVQGMTRMGLAFQPAEGTTYSDAAFAAGCGGASRTAEHVLALGSGPGPTAALRSLGFAPVLERVVLQVRHGPAR